MSVLASRIYLFEKSSGEMLNEYTGHFNKIYNLEACMNNTCSLIYSGSEDGFVYEWDLVDARVRNKLKHENYRAVQSIDYHPSQEKLLSAQENYVYYWSLD